MPNSEWYNKTCCDRCGKGGALIMSMFNQQMICMDCKNAETKRSDYKQAEAQDMREYAGRLRSLGMEHQAQNVEKLADEIVQEQPERRE